MLPSVSPYVRSRSSGVSTYAASIVCGTRARTARCARRTLSPQLVPPRVPVPSRSSIRHVLDERGHHVPALGRQRRVDVGRDHAVDPQLVGQLAPLGAGRSMRSATSSVGHQRDERPAVRIGVGRHARPRRLGVQHEVHLGARAVHLDRRRSRRGSPRGSSLGSTRPQERALRVGVGHHGARGDLGAVLQHHAGRASAARVDPAPPARRCGSRRRRRSRPRAIAWVIAPMPPITWP